MEEHQIHDSSKPFVWWQLPLRMGIIIAVIKIVLATIQNKFLIDNIVLATILQFISFVTGVILLVYTSKQQRKAMGGYIEFKEAFQAIFIATLVFVPATIIYDTLYVQVIDPSFMERSKEALLTFYQKMNVSQEQIDAASDMFDEQNEYLSIKGKIMSILMTLVAYGIVGFIIAAATKKPKAIF